MFRIILLMLALAAFLQVNAQSSSPRMLARAHKGNKVGFIDTKGQEVIPVKFDAAEYFREGYVSVKLNGQCGI